MHCSPCARVHLRRRGENHRIEPGWPGTRQGWPTSAEFPLLGDFPRDWDVGAGEENDLYAGESSPWLQMLDAAARGSAKHTFMPHLRSREPSTPPPCSTQARDVPVHLGRAVIQAPRSTCNHHFDCPPSRASRMYPCGLISFSDLGSLVACRERGVKTAVDEAGALALD